VKLERDNGMAAVEEDIEPHGCPEDAAAINAWLDPLGIIGVNNRVQFLNPE
jgi:hypothetical protein